MAGYDLLCTYGPGALDAVLAHTLFADAYRLAPLVHHEGPGGERDRSTFFRRIALGRTAALVVSTRELEQVALGSWQQPRSRVRPIPDGIDIAAYAAAPKRDAVPGLVKRRGELWLGTLASPGSAGLLGPLIRSLATLPPEWQLVIGGELPEDVDAVQEAARAGVEDRVHSVALPAHRATLIGLFDLYAAPSAGGGTMEAMAAGLPILAPRGGEAEALVSTANAPLLADGADDTALGAALVPLLDKATRRRVGEANRVKATAEFDQKQMIDRSRALYLNLLGRG
jgi:glycosyltransferase involved in cell wall biosynthesis